MIAFVRRYATAALLLAAAFTATAEEVSRYSAGIDDGEVPHPEWRERAYPVSQSVSGPVTFLWPVPSKHAPEDEKFLTHEFVLARSMDLEDPIYHEHLQWAFFNTHRQLQPGTYFWRYRIFQGETVLAESPVMTFEQTGKAQGLVSANARAFVSAVPAARPRLLGTPGELGNLTRLNEDPAMRQSIIDGADTYVGLQLPDRQFGGKFLRDGKQVLINSKFPSDHPKSKPTGRIFYNAIKALGKAYLLSGDERYAREGVRYTLRVASFPLEDVRAERVNFLLDDFDVAALLPALGYGIDTFYQHFSDAERDVVAGALGARLRASFDYYRNRLEARVIDNHAWQHTLAGFFEATIAARHLVPEADMYLEYAYGVWVARFPLQSVTDGGWSNGRYSAVNIETWTHLPLFIRRYTGTDFYTHPFFRNQIDWIIARFPPNSWADGFGGDGYELEDRLSPSWAAWLNILNAELKVDKINWYLTEWGYPDHAVKPDWLRTVEGLPSDHAASREFDASAHRRSYLFVDTGIVNIVDNWEDAGKRLSVAFRSAPWGNFGHNLPSSNAVNILYGGLPLVYPTGYRHGGKLHSFEWYRHSRSHNTLLINGKGQPVSAEAWGQITNYIDNGDVVFVRGDASQAYTGTPSPQWYERFSRAGVDWYAQMEAPELAEFQRNVVYVDPGIVVIYDELDATSEVEYDWRFHTPYSLEVAGQQAVFDNGLGRAAALFHSDTPLTLSVEDRALHKPENVEGRRSNGMLDVYEDVGYHLNINGHGAKKFFLAVFAVSAVNQPAARVVEDAPGSITIGELSISANLDRAGEACLHVSRGKVPLMSLVGASVNVGGAVPANSCLSPVQTSNRVR
jgi:hypothetical protein